MKMAGKRSRKSSSELVEFEPVTTPPPIADPFPRLKSVEKHVPEIETLAECRREVHRLYRFARCGKITDQQMTRFIYAVGEISRIMRSERELELTREALAKSVPFTGITFIVDETAGSGKPNGKGNGAG